MAEFTFSLPWPADRLWPNKGHGRNWSAIKDSKALARRAGCLMAGQAGLTSADTLVRAEVTYHPTARQKVDDDNAIAAFKSYRDGIADCLGVDDRTFNHKFTFWIGEARPRNVVIVRVVTGSLDEEAA